ncbi:KamA family radical SAM protein, partial [Acinetobacter baumannii]
CFRRHFPYQENLPKNEDWLNIKNYIESNPDINEVILSGGDPLTLSNRKLALWLERLSSLKQVKILRIHSRVPIVIPNRIDEELISLLKNSRLRIILVVHSNHASELDDFTCSKLLQLSEHHITVLNQAVLLKGVNDSAQTLTDLSYRLFEARVMPYYLHVLDKVKGAQHFDLIPSEIDAIYQDVLASLPGYLVPKLVREIAGEKNKTPLFGATTF